MPYCFEIAGVRYRVETELPYFPGAPLCRFMTDPALPVDYSCQFVSTQILPDPAGPCLHQNDHVRIYGTGDIQQRFLYGDGGDMACILLEKDRPRIQVLLGPLAPEMNDNLVILAMALEQKLLGKGGLILHASYIGIGGQAILFTAPSGTGKSTQAELWRQHMGAEILNGDRACIRIEQGRVMAMGLPIAGTSGICENRGLPIRAIVGLQQRKENDLRTLRGAEAFRQLLSGTWVNSFCPEDVKTMADLLVQVMERVPVYALGCRPDAQAVALLAEELHIRKP